MLYEVITGSCAFAGRRRSGRLRDLFTAGAEPRERALEVRLGIDEELSGDDDRNNFV